jgi:hypothetical protein
MATVEETIGAKPQLGAGLTEGMLTLSGNETVTFTLYVKLVLPLDGYVFWVNAALVNDSALYNALTYGFGMFNNPNSAVLPARTLSIPGSFHFSTDLHQLEDRNVSHNHVIFTSPQLIQDFNLINPNLMYVASYQEIKFAFSRRDNYFKQADLYHYKGDALYAVMTTQLIDSMAGFDTSSVIVSNSLPIWLALNNYFPMYPAFLSGLNYAPPYATIDITDTTAIQSFPLVDRNSNPNQLVKDTVKVTIYGIRNNEALNFMEYVFQSSINTDNFGMMNLPVVVDEKLTQPEFGIIAMKKSIEFEVSYYQTTVNNVARKLITEAFCSFNPV